MKEKLKEIWKHGRGTAIFVLIAVILLTLFSDANLSLLSKRGDVRDAYRDAGFDRALDKCADELGMICDAANKAGISAEEAEKAAAALRKKASDPIGAVETLDAFFMKAVTLYDDLNDAGAVTDAVKKHYDAIGTLLRQLAQSEEYNEAREKYEALRGNFLCRFFAPWFREAADLTALYERFYGYFDILPDPVLPDPGGLLDFLFGSLTEATGEIGGLAVKGVSWLLDFLGGAIYKVLKIGRRTAGLLVLIVIAGIFVAAKLKSGGK